MRQQLIKYVDLLFAGAADAEDIKQEILQNTLDRYDDLVSQGKTPEAAYRLAISGIGDINEILSTPVQTSAACHSTPEKSCDSTNRRAKRAAAVAMYIACPIPLFVLGDMGHGTLGLCLLLLLVAAATALLVTTAKDDPEDPEMSNPSENITPREEQRRSITRTIRIAALTVFLILSFLTGAWFITWLIFPIASAIRGVILACIDLKEAK